MKKLSVIAAAVAVLAAATACGSSSPDVASSAPPPAVAASSAPAASAAATSAPAPSTPAAAVLTIKDFTFGVPATVAAGATVRVTNADSEAHTVTADAGGVFDTMVAAGGSASFAAPAKPGRYPFHCTYHGNMHGVLIVT